MAKYTQQLEGDFDLLLKVLEDAALSSASASFEEGSDWQEGDTRVAVRVYERYSMIGSNRVSLSITLIGKGRGLYVTAITSGGSQAVFFKVNRFGEEASLDIIESAVEAARRP